ncbi:MAG: hypothetical protein R3C45_05065 [Phycisphaerales bacterium]
MIYPMVLAFVATGVVIFLLSWFIPVLIDLRAVRPCAPAINPHRRGASLMVRDYGLIIGIMVLILVIVLRMRHHLAG